MNAAFHASRRSNGPTVRGTLARVWLSLLLCLQLVGFAGSGSPAAAHGAADLAALGKAVGHSVVLCRHGDERSPRHDPSDHTDCCQLGLCQHAPLAVAFVQGVVVPASRPRDDVRRVRRIADAVPTNPSLFGAVSPRGPPSSI